jgi:hypothetical protein
MGRWLTFPASRFPERVIGIGFFNRLPVAVLNVAGPWPASAHLTRKLDHAENAHARLPTVKFLVGFQRQEVRGAVPLEICELLESRMHFLSLNLIGIKVDGLGADRLVLFLHG